MLPPALVAKFRPCKCMGERPVDAPSRLLFQRSHSLPASGFILSQPLGFAFVGEVPIPANAPRGSARKLAATPLHPSVAVVCSTIGSIVPTLFLLEDHRFHYRATTTLSHRHARPESDRRRFLPASASAAAGSDDYARCPSLHLSAPFQLLILLSTLPMLRRLQCGYTLFQVHKLPHRQQPSDHRHPLPAAASLRYRLLPGESVPHGLCRCPLSASTAAGRVPAGLPLLPRPGPPRNPSSCIHRCKVLRDTPASPCRFRVLCTPSAERRLLARCLPKVSDIHWDILPPP